MMIYCPMCDRTLDGDYVEFFEVEGENICIDCDVNKVKVTRDDLIGFYQACEHSNPEQKADAYLIMQDKFYGGNHD